MIDEERQREGLPTIRVDLGRIARQRRQQRGIHRCVVQVGITADLVRTIEKRLREHGVGHAISDGGRTGTDGGRHGDRVPELGHLGVQRRERDRSAHRRGEAGLHHAIGGVGDRLIACIEHVCCGRHLFMKHSVRSRVVGRPGIPHRNGNMVEIASMDGRTGTVLADCMQQSLAPDSRHRATIADVAHIVLIRIGLIGILVLGTVVFGVGPAIVVEIVRLADISEAIAVDVGLTRIRLHAAVVRAIEDPVAVGIRRAIIRDPVVIRVVVERIAVAVRVLGKRVDSVTIIVDIEGIDDRVPVGIPR